MSKAIKYFWADAWLLGAIAEASRKQTVELWQIIVAGDNLNHTVFTPEELKNGLVRLKEGNWINEENMRFYVTEQFKVLKLHIKNIDSIEKLGKILKTEPEDLNNLSNNLKYPGFNQAVLSEAIDKYSQFMRGIKKKYFSNLID
jgi:hypothetical protein